MRKRNMLQNLGIGLLTMALTVSSVSASVTENAVAVNGNEITELETEMHVKKEESTEIQRNAATEELSGTESEIVTELEELPTTESETLQEDSEQNITEQQNAAGTESNSEKWTEKQEEPQTETGAERDSEWFTEVNSENDTENVTEVEDAWDGSQSEAGELQETEEIETGVLTAKSENMDITILAPEENGFPAGAKIVLYAGEDLEKICKDNTDNWSYENFLEQIKGEWKQEAKRKYGRDINETDCIQYLYPYYFKVVNKEGLELALPKEVQVYVNIEDDEAYENEKAKSCVSTIGFHESKQVTVIKNCDVSCNSDKKCLAVDTKAEKNGLYSLVQLKNENVCACESSEKEGLFHSWTCPVFQKAMKEECDCGSMADTVTGHDVSCNGVWEAFHAACSGCVAESTIKGVLHDDCEVVLRIHGELCRCDTRERNLEKIVEDHDENSDFVKYIMQIADYLNSQTDSLAADKGQIATENISNVSGWSNGSNASSDHFAAKFYAGKSSMEIVGGSTVAGKWIQGSMSNKSCLYWLPLQDNLSDAGSHGALYHNVIYDYKTGKWYDMKFTIQAYQKTVLSGSKKTVYPFVGFYKNKLQFGFDREGPMVIRCQILEAGTSTQAKIKVKIPVWDIDDAQYVGIKQNNGSMDHRYYYTGANEWLRAKNSVSIAGEGGFFYVEGKFGTSAKRFSTPQACAVWEMTTSDFSFALGYYNNNTTAESTRWDRFHIFSTNTTIGDGSYGANGTYGVVAIFSQDTTAPAFQSPEKRVSADNKTWKKSLELSSLTGSFYYAIDYTVLDTIPAYKFSSLFFYDTLPNGVDYVSDLKVTRLEDGKTKTNWFTTSTDGDKIRLDATADALAEDDFYGYTYRISFKVKMDPTEIEPVYQAASGKDVYTVNNKGSVRVNRGNVSSNSSTNTVTTTASRTLPVITVSKKNEENVALSGATYQIIAKNDITSLAGKVLYKSGAVVETIVTEKNGKATSGRLHPGTYTVKETKAPVGYALNQTGKDAKVNYLNPDTAAGSADLSFVNKRLYSTICITKEIDTADIVWAHGNPIFTFKVSGKDVLGNPHTYYDIVEFTKNNTGSGTKATLTAVFKVLAGTYTLSEEKTARYQLASIHSVVNGSVSGNTAVIQVEGKQTDTAGPVGSAVFYNQKTTDGGQGDAVFVRNSIKK